MPDFTWRGVRYPVTARSASFSHDSVRHSIQYQNGTFVEQLGAREWTFTYTIPMREDIARGPFANLFTLGLPILARDCRNREAGELIDPILGPFKCVPTSFTDDSDPNRRDGTDVRVEFLHSPDLDETPEIKSPGNLGAIVADAGQLDVAVQAADWQQEPSPEGMTDILSAINGVMRQGPSFVDRGTASLHDLAFKLEKIAATADKVQSPQSWGVRAAARRTRSAAVNLANRANTNPITIVTRYAKTVSAVAAEAGMTVADLLKANPALARSPIVPKGTTVHVR
jgi:hypothetical protein